MEGGRPARLGRALQAGALGARPRQAAGGCALPQSWRNHGWVPRARARDQRAAQPRKREPVCLQLSRPPARPLGDAAWGRVGRGGGSGQGLFPTTDWFPRGQGPGVLGTRRRPGPGAVGLSAGVWPARTGVRFCGACGPGRAAVAGRFEGERQRKGSRSGVLVAVRPCGAPRPRAAAARACFARGCVQAQEPVVKIRAQTRGGARRLYVCRSNFESRWEAGADRSYPKPPRAAVYPARWPAGGPGGCNAWGGCNSNRKRARAHCAGSV